MHQKQPPAKMALAVFSEAGALAACAGFALDVETWAKPAVPVSARMAERRIRIFEKLRFTTSAPVVKLRQSKMAGKPFTPIQKPLSS
jgi:hypothetical protein